MPQKMIIEAIGYIGSGLVVVSMLMSSVVRLRVINMIGSVIFTVYALIIRSYPTALMNLCLVAINIYHLVRLLRISKHWELVEGSISDSYMKFLLSYFREDIARYFPGFSLEKLQGKPLRVFEICCDNELAGVFIGSGAGDSLRMELDYSIPTYRDCSVGTYLLQCLPKHGVRELSYDEGIPEHIGYLKKMGFTQESDGSLTKKL